MIYKAFLNRQEITGFPVKGKETSEIWGGNTLLWQKIPIEKFKFRLTPKTANSFGVSGEHVTIEFTDNQGNKKSVNYGNQLANIDCSKVYLKCPLKYTQYVTIWGAKLNLCFTNTLISRIYSPLPRSMNREFVGLIFEECHELKNISQNLLKNLTDLKRTIRLFRNSGIRNIPGGLFDNCLNLEEAQETFEGTDIKYVPSDLSSKNPKLKQVYGLFMSCSNLSYSNSGFLSTQPLIDVFGVFAYCGSLTSVNSDFAKNAQPENAISPNRMFRGCFYGDQNLQSAPNFYNDFPNTKNENVAGCYYGCKKLNFYASLPEEWTQYLKTWDVE